jgi:uncharacterized membrane protein
MSALAGRWAFFFAAVAAASLCVTDLAYAFQRNISFCNRTEGDVDVAIGYDRSGTSETTSDGWFKVRACTCRSIVSAELRATEIFFLVTDVGTDNLLSDARGPLCVHPSDAFTYVSENASRGRCEGVGGRWVNFKFFDTRDRVDYKLNFRADGECNLMD